MLTPLGKQLPAQKQPGEAHIVLNLVGSQHLPEEMRAHVHNPYGNWRDSKAASVPFDCISKFMPQSFVQKLMSILFISLPKTILSLSTGQANN